MIEPGQPVSRHGPRYSVPDPPHRQELRAQECHTDNLQAFAAHDYQFHHESLAAAGNRVVEKLEEMLTPLRNSLIAIRLRRVGICQRVMLDHFKGCKST